MVMPEQMTHVGDYTSNVMRVKTRFLNSNSLDCDLVGENGKGDSFYNVHPYHTKVPVSIMVSLIEHYTKMKKCIHSRWQVVKTTLTATYQRSRRR
jgi:hypothetical protein